MALVAASGLFFMSMKEMYRFREYLFGKTVDEKKENELTWDERIVDQVTLLIILRASEPFLRFLIKFLLFKFS